MEQQQLEWLAASLGALVSLVAFVKWVWPLIRQGYRNVMDHSLLQRRLEEVADQLSFVVSEMKVNGGATIKDALIRIEGSVALTNERQRARMLDSPDLVFETDPQGSCVWVNRTYARSVKRLPQELMGHGWVNAIAPEYRDRVVQGWDDAVTEDREFEMHFDFATPEGVILPALVRSYKMTDSRGYTIGYLGSITLNPTNAH